jgi:hypothetical protein
VKNTLLRIRIPAIIAILTAIVFSGIIAYAQPGSETDPVVSLSYLETATSFQPVALEGGEELSIESGSGVILIQGSAGLVVPIGGQSKIIDISDGSVMTGDIEMLAGHMYIPIMLDSGDLKFIIRPWESSVIAIPGGSGR